MSVAAGQGEPLPAEVAAVLPRLAALDGVAPRQIRASPLGGWSNTVWRLDTPLGTLVLRLPGKAATNALARADEAHNLRLAADAGVAVPPLQIDAADGLMLTPFVATSTPHAPATNRPERVGHLLGRLHRSSAAFRWQFVGESVAARQLADIPYDDPGMPLVHRCEPQALALLRDLEATRGPLVPCHNDPNPANILDDGQRLWLIDWEYSGLNDPFWDLAAFAEEAALDAAGCAELLAGWGDNGPAACDRLGQQRAACRWIAGLWFLDQAAKRDDAELRREAMRRLEAW